MVSLLKLIHGFVLIVCALILESVIFGIAFYYAWNLSMPRLFELPVLTLVDGGVIMFLSRAITFSMQKWYTVPQNNVPVIKINAKDLEDGEKN